MGNDASVIGQVPETDFRDRRKFQREAPRRFLCACGGPTSGLGPRAGRFRTYPRVGLVSLEERLNLLGPMSACIYRLWSQENWNY